MGLTFFSQKNYKAIVLLRAESAARSFPNAQKQAVKNGKLFLQKNAEKLTARYRLDEYKGVAPGTRCYRSIM